MPLVGTGTYTSELKADFPRLPPGQTIGVVSMGGPNDIARDRDGVFYICEQEADGAPAYICIRDGARKVLAKWETRHAHGLTVDAHGDIYVGLTTSHNVDKYVRRTQA